jgi:hypothetical protein
MVEFLAVPASGRAESRGFATVGVHRAIHEPGTINELKVRMPNPTVKKSNMKLCSG